MPIKIPETLPAHDILRQEGVMVMGEDQATRQDIRPLQIGLLNLMPKKVQTETQFARLIGATPLQIELTLIRMSEHESRHTAPEHMEAFYKPFSEARAQRFDGLIITGAPIEHLPFGDVTYIDELREVFEWTRTHVHSTFGVCWGGMAMINHFYGVQKHILEAKAFGAYRHQTRVPSSPFLRGFSDDFVIPVSRWTEMREAEIAAVDGLEILLASDEVGVCLVNDPVQVPVNYYPDDDPARLPENRWRSHAHLLYGNWINEIYQTTPFNLADLKKD